MEHSTVKPGKFSSCTEKWLLQSFLVRAGRHDNGSMLWYSSLEERLDDEDEELGRKFSHSIPYHG
jgi:hypothetical protein